MYDVEPEDEKQRMKTPVRLRRPIDATRGHLLKKWVVSSSILSRFGPRGRLDASTPERGVAAMASGAYAIDATRQRPEDDEQTRSRRVDGVPRH